MMTACRKAMGGFVLAGALAFVVSAGQSRRTGTLNIARTCGYHDHNRDMVESLQGTIVIQ